jgi:predicted RNA-binding Zn-ribbon protein involved in translation (DUF1610 family)
VNIPEGATHRSEGFFYRKAGNSWQLFGGNHGWIESACEDSWLDANAEPLITKAQPCRTDGRCEHAIQSGAEKEGSCPAGKCAMPCDNSAAHLTIPGALEWDGDNGTHGADAESRADGESLLLAAAGEHVEEHLSKQIDILTINLSSVRAQLDNTEQSRRSFFDLSQDLEKRLAERDALLAKCKDWIEAARDGVLYPIANEFQGVVGHNAEGLGQQSVALLDALAAIAEPAKCESCGGWGHIETEDSAHDCPECGPSLVERAVEAGVMNAPKPYVAMTEAEADEFLSSFGGGSGNKAKRRIAALAAKAKPESFPCWSCRKPVTLEGRAAADGFCPHCTVELDLEGGDDE